MCHISKNVKTIPLLSILQLANNKTKWIEVFVLGNLKAAIFDETVWLQGDYLLHRHNSLSKTFFYNYKNSTYFFRITTQPFASDIKR